MEEKIVVDLDHPVWLSEPGFGPDAINIVPYCALGKLSQVLGVSDHKHERYEHCINMFGESFVGEVWRTNDEGGLDIPENHWKAVRMVLEALANNPNVELKGTKISDVIKEKINV